MDRRLAIGAALLALAACGRGGGGAAEESAPPANIVINAPEGQVAVRTGGPATAGPDGVPAYPNAAPGSSVDITGAPGGSQGGISGFRTGDTPAQVVAFYAQALAGAGYRIASQMNLGPATSSLTAQRGEGEAVNVTATQVGGATQVQIIVARGGR
jgi:hypothetical protein